MTLNLRDFRSDVDRNDVDISRPFVKAEEQQQYTVKLLIYDQSWIMCTTAGWSYLSLWKDSMDAFSIHNEDSEDKDDDYESLSLKNESTEPSQRKSQMMTNISIIMTLK